jgi:enterochelin esterase-like enzyme
MDRTLDNLVGRTVAPLVVAFVPQADWSESMSGIAKYSRALDQELIPLLDTTYRTMARPEARGVMGAGEAAAISTYATFERPGLFGKLATQSLYMRDLEDDVHELIEKSNSRQLDLYIEWSRHDLKEYSRIDAQAESRAVVEALKKKGYHPIAREAVGGSGWGGWRQRTDRVLESLFPLE